MRNFIGGTKRGTRQVWAHAGALAALSAMGGCAADTAVLPGDVGDSEVVEQRIVPGPGSVTRRPPEGLTPAQPRPKVRELEPIVSSEVENEGTLCPTGPLSTDARTGSFATSVFGEIVALAGPYGEPPEVTRGDCTLRVPVTVPAGYGLSRPYVCATVGLAGEAGDDSARARVKMRMWFDGSPVTERVEELSGDASGASVCMWAAEEVATSCHEPSRAQQTRLNVAFELEAGLGSIVTLQNVEGDLSYASGAKWRSCGNSGPLLPGASAAGDPCGGPNQHACASGLWCKPTNEVGSEKPDDGICQSG